jgi:RHS repeat-associated protein
MSAIARAVTLAVLLTAAASASAFAQYGTVSVTPDGGASTKGENQSGLTVTFTVSNSGAIEPQLYDLTCSTSGNVSSCAVLGNNPVTVPANGSALVQVSFSTGPAPSPGTVTLQASTYQCNPEDDLGCNSDTGYFTITVTNIGYAPIVDATPYNPEKQDYGLCALACFAATYAYSTVPYFSLDTPRNVTLVYNGDRVNPRPFVHVNVSHSSGSPMTPSEYRFEVRVNNGSGSFANVTFTNAEQVLRFAYPGTTAHRIGGQFDASSYATGVYDMEIIVSSVYPGGTVSSSVLTKLVVVNETNAPVARGWTIAGIQRLYTQADGSALITEGDGSAVYFSRFCPTCAFTRPYGEFSRLTEAGSGSGKTWTRAYPDSTKATFDYLGRLVRVADRFGNRDSIIYDGSGRPWKILDPQTPSREIVLTYGTYGISTISDPWARYSSFTVQSNRTLIRLTDPDGNRDSLIYDGNLRLRTIRNRRGHATSLSYNAQSQRVDTITGPAVAIFGEGTVSPTTRLLTWQTAGVPYVATESPNPPFSPQRADTVRAAITDPAGHVTRFTVNRFGQPLVTTDALDNQISVTYNANGQTLTVTNPLGLNASYGYDADGFMTSWSVGGVGGSARRATGWMLADSMVSGGVGQRILLNSRGLADSVRVGGRASIHDSLQTTYRYAWDTRGRLDSVLDPRKHLLVRLWYQGTNSNVSKDSVPTGLVSTYGYDSYGRLTTVSQTGQPTRTTGYDPLNRPTSYNDGVNPVTVLAYEDSLNLTRVTDARNQSYRFSYNALGWLTQRTDPGNYSDLYQYSRDGELRRWTNRRGQNVDLAYDVIHRRTVRTADGQTDSLSYTPNGRVITASNPVSVETIYLSARRLPDSVRTVYSAPNQTYWRRYYYNPQGWLDSMKASHTGNAVTFLRRQYARSLPLGTLDSLRLGNNWTRFRYNSDIDAIVTKFPGPDSIVRGFTSLHGPDSIRSGSVLYDRYGYDTYSRVERVTDALTAYPHRYRQFVYDSVARLARTNFGLNPSGCGWTPDRGVVCSGGGVDSTHTFSYDAVGNRTDGGGASYTTTGNRIQNFGGCSYTTDLDGNVTSRTCGSQTVTFTWSADSRLTGFTISGGPTIAFRYDALGRLAARDSAGAANGYFLWDGASLLAELSSGANTEVAEYSYYGIDNLHAVLPGGSAAYHAHADALGNMIALTNQSGALVTKYSFSEWGVGTVLEDSAAVLGTRNRVRWKGALWMGPELELYYMRNRWYEPRTGRFLSEDPIGFAGGINAYTFAGSQPIGGFDPFGLDPCPPGKEPPSVPGKKPGEEGAPDKPPYATDMCPQRPQGPAEPWSEVTYGEPWWFPGPQGAEPLPAITMGGGPTLGSSGSPTVWDALNDPNISQRLYELGSDANLAYLQPERGFDVTADESGRLFYTPERVGEVGRLRGPPVPGTIVSVHNHPDISPGMIGGPMYAGDFAYFSRYNVAMVAIDRHYIYVWVQGRPPGQAIFRRKR